MIIKKIVITGGPCAGKSTAMSWVQNAFTQKGYTVLFVPETATELITGGVAPWTCGDNLSYQKCQMRLQLEKESVFLEAARSMNAEKILIVCDRGALDNKAYMNDEELDEVLRSVHTNRVELRDGYDAVFHLVTAARGAAEFYTTDNNQARKESVEEAIAVDDRLIAAWTGHPRLRIIDNATGFEDKMKRLIAEISAFLGESGPVQIQRRFLIEYPDTVCLECAPNCHRLDIIQTFLTAAEGEERRVCQRGEAGNFMYYETIERPFSEQKRVEVERRLTQGEYLRLLMDADGARRPIRKTRYCLTEGGHCYEIDLFPFWDHQAILEIKLTSEEETVDIPERFRVLREVTGDNNYKNASLAKI